MPIIESAIKRARQNETRRERRQPFKTRLKTTIRTFTDLMKEGKKDEAAKMLPAVMKVIDTAADRKKSRLSLMVSKK